MDIATVGAAFNGLKVAKDVFTWLLESKIEAESRAKVVEALKAVGEAQDELFRLREDLFGLQTENNQLKAKLAEKEAWKERSAQYSLVQTAGGAVVYRCVGEPLHYVCPRCIEKKEVHILQDLQGMSGEYACPSCDRRFRIKLRREPPRINGGSGHWMG